MLFFDTVIGHKELSQFFRFLFSPVSVFRFRILGTTFIDVAAHVHKSKTITLGQENGVNRLYKINDPLPKQKELTKIKHNNTRQ